MHTLMSQIKENLQELDKLGYKEEAKELLDLVLKLEADEVNKRLFNISYAMHKQEIAEINLKQIVNRKNHLTYQRNQLY